MSVEIVIHKGFQEALYENSLMGILIGIFQAKSCEFDILFVEGVWKICHDFNSISRHTIPFTELLKILKQYKHRIHKTIIIDIKWDFVRNHNDNLYQAIHTLYNILANYKDYPFWLQASNTKILDAMITLCLPNDIPWKIGLIVYNMNDFYTHKQDIYYAMISLTDFSLEEIRAMYNYHQCLLFGYTCHDSKELCHYKHLFPYLKGIVCDVSL